MAQDPFRYFRLEAREGTDALRKGLRDLADGAAPPEATRELLRLAHTLKGAAYAVRLPEIADLCHRLEDLLIPVRDQATPAGQALIENCLTTTGRIADLVSALDHPASTASAGPAPQPRPPDLTRNERFETVRIELAQANALADELGELAVELHALGDAVRSLKSESEVPQPLAAPVGRQQVLEAQLEAAQRSLAAARQRAEDFRSLPASSVFDMLEHTAWDTARTLGRKVEFRASGGEIRLQAQILSMISEALIHVVRNAVAHGIEPATERTTMGKSPAGVVELRVERHGDRIAFVCSDDGRGIDFEAVRGAAGAEATAAGSSPEALTELLLRGGLSTARTVTQVSGRGIGLDVLRATAQRLRAKVGVRSSPGAGATFEIELPISLTSFDVLLLEQGDMTVSVPLDCVQKVLQTTADQLLGAPDQRVLPVDQRMVRFALLAHVLPGVTATTQRGRWQVVLLRSQGGEAALGVDTIRGISHIIARPLPPPLDAISLVIGAALDIEGVPRLVLEPAHLIEAIGAVRATIDDTSTERAPILVVDDSLTSRMLERGILEAAGFDVEVATSGEEALTKARHRRYSLFVVDVEMPGISGFELVRQVRADPILHDIPCMLLTSLGSVKDRQQGERAGASAYIVKSEFDQARFLATVQQLMG